MNISFEALIVTILFLLPGFFVFYTRKRLEPASSDKPDNFELGLLSFGYSVVLSAIEAFFFAVIITIFVGDISTILNDPRKFFAENYLITVGFIALWIIFALILALLFGTFDLYLYLLRLINKNRRNLYANHDIWHNVLNIQREAIGQSTFAGATVHLKNGDVYEGHIQGFQTHSDEEGNRSFILQNITFSPGKDANPIFRSQYGGDHSFVLINTRDVDSIDIHMIPANTSQDLPPSN